LTISEPFLTLTYSISFRATILLCPIKPYFFRL
jgi:hypothetical protein